MKVRIILSVLLLMAALTMKAQQAPVAAGSNATGSGGSVAYSVGQVVYTTNSGSNGSVTQGVQQPFEISAVIGGGNPNINLEMIVYPNPTTDYLTLSITNYDISQFSYRLFDAGGKLIASKKITSVAESIRMINLPSATYFLNVITDNKAIKTFKIVKN